MSKLVISASRGQSRGQQGTRMFYSASNQTKGASMCYSKGKHNHISGKVKKDGGFYGHFDVGAMKNNVVNTTGGCKEIGQHNTEKYDGHFERTIHSKHDVIKSHSEEVAG